jgi:diguanylate cyclase (GGDEF)-like protein
MTMPGFLRVQADGVLLSVKLQPRASANEIGDALGDELLRAVGKMVLAGVRAKVDASCRIDARRFGILLPHTTRGNPGAGLVAERLRVSVERAEFLDRSHDVLGRFTISQGIAEYPYHVEEADDLAEAAASALTTAMQAGSDRVMVYAARG